MVKGVISRRGITHFIIGVFFLILISGCVDRISGASQYSTEYAHNINYTDASNKYDTCKEGFCECMVCKNNSFLFGAFTSFAGGNCKFVIPCDQQTYDLYRTPAEHGGSDYTLRHFMLGAGPSFYDFGDANAYCNNKLTMAVHWLTGSKTRDYSLPSPGRALCMLDKGVIPVYVLYSNGKNIDATRSAKIGRVLGEGAYDVTLGRLCDNVGPVIVTTEIDYNISDANDVEKIVDQIIQINEGCGNTPAKINCFVAIAPRMGDTAALDAVMSNPRLPKRYVHLLAYGINSHYDNGTCNGAMMREQAVKFSRYGLYKYGLPSVIPYVLFDEGTSDSTGKCVWSEENVQNAYAGFFPKGIISLLGAGVIGIAPYDFNSSSSHSDPLQCKDCAIAANAERFASWYGGCQKFTAIDENRSSGQIPIIFPNESGGYCDYGIQPDAIYHMYRNIEGDELYLPPDPNLSDAEEKLFRCDACVVEANITDFYDVFEEFIPAEIDEYICTAYPELDYYSSLNNVDPMLTRAVVIGESGFDKCALAAISPPDKPTIEFERTSYNVTSNEYKDITATTQEGTGYYKGFTRMYDPDGNCEFDQSQLGGEPAYTFRGAGLLQTLTPPYTYWPAEYRADGQNGPNWPLWDEIDKMKDWRSGHESASGITFEAARTCSENFNPFNSTHAACLGTMKLHDDIERGKNWTDEFNDRDSRCPDLFEIEGDPPKRDILGTFVGLYKFSGIWDKAGDNPACGGLTPGECWAMDYCAIRFCAERESDDCGLACEEKDGKCVPSSSSAIECQGESDFISYINCRIPCDYCNDCGSTCSGRKGIFNKMGYYIYLNSNCKNSYCPGWIKLMQKGKFVSSEMNPDFVMNTQDPYSIYGEAWQCGESD